MFSSTWRSDITFGGVVAGALVACLWIAHMAGQPSRSHEQGQNSEAAQRDQELAKDRPSVKVKRPSADTSICRQAKTEKEYELCQQWRSAEAAQDAADTAWLQYIVSAVGLAGIVGAVYYAAKSARAATVAATASQATVTTMQENAQRELRAYLSVIPLVLLGLRPNEKPHLIYEVRNVGSTPAHETRHAAAIRIEQHPLPDGFPFPNLGDLGYVSRSVLWREYPIPYKAHSIEENSFTGEEIIEILHGHRPGKGRRLYIFGQIEYLDAFKREHWTRFCYSFIGRHDLIEPARAGKWGVIQPPFELELAGQHNETDYD